LKDFILVALVESNYEASELTYIYKVASVGFRAKQLGKDAYRRMKKGDFTNTPKIRKKIKKENIKGYGINAE